MTAVKWGGSESNSILELSVCQFDWWLHSFATKNSNNVIN